jgi:hypothetical protein
MEREEEKVRKRERKGKRREKTGYLKVEAKRNRKR